MILVDADVLVYRFSNASEYVSEWHDDLWTLHGDLGQAKDMLAQFVSELKADLGMDEVRMFLSEGSNFRKEVYPPYKANRKSKRKPILFAPFRQHIRDEYDCEEVAGLEADDLLGRAGYRRSDRIVATIDKDLHTCECKVYNWDKPELGVQTINSRDAAVMFYTQILTGDSVDNYPGCKGIGPKTAEKILEPCESPEMMREAVLKTYRKSNLSPEFALTQARCAYILKKPTDWHPETGVNLWTPPFSV